MRRRFALPALLFTIHAIAILLFAFLTFPLAGPDADGGAMLWIVWGWLDFPLGFVAMFLAGTASSNLVAVTWMLVIGGLQWAIWGLLFDLLLSYLGRTKA